MCSAMPGTRIRATRSSTSSWSSHCGCGHDGAADHAAARAGHCALARSTARWTTCASRRPAATAVIRFARAPSTRSRACCSCGEWLWQIHALGPEASFEPLIRPALEFGLKTPIHTMIERFRTARSHLAVVIDDEKRLAGIVTFEDVLEEIVVRYSR